MSLNKRYAIVQKVLLQWNKVIMKKLKPSLLISNVHVVPTVPCMITVVPNCRRKNQSYVYLEKSLRPLDYVIKWAQKSIKNLCVSETALRESLRFFVGSIKSIKCQSVEECALNHSLHANIRR